MPKINPIKNSNVDMLRLHTTVPYYNNLILGVDISANLYNYRIIDFSKYRQQGILNGSIVYENNLIRFNPASSTYVNFPYNNIYNITDNFTFSCVFKSYDTTTEFVLLSTKNISGASGYYFSITTNSFNIYTTSNNTLALSYNYLDTNFHTITVSKTDSSVSGIKIYIDGILVGSLSGTITLTTSSALILGRMYGSTSSNYTNGYISQLFLWSGVNISLPEVINIQSMLKSIDVNNPISRVTEEITNIYSEPQSNNLYYINNSIQFNILSKYNISNITWDFNSESTSTIINPTYTFTSSGIKIISVTFTENGIVKTLSKNINIRPILQGGVITYVDGYTVHTFISSAQPTLTVLGNCDIELLVVAGGGSGGRYGGGGGAGGLLYYGSETVAGKAGNSFSVSSGSYGVTIGLGGASSSGDGINGGNSVFGSITAIGGGGGGQNAVSNGKTGGSGGGNGGTLIAGQGTVGQGNNGGTSTSAGGGGGGGGAGSVGGNNHTGGTGLSISISGTPTFYAGGGGGGIFSANGGVGGNGGGGNGGNNNTVGFPGTDGLGGGGGGGSAISGQPKDGGKGGNGIIILRYLT